MDDRPNEGEPEAPREAAPQAWPPPPPPGAEVTAPDVTAAPQPGPLGAPVDWQAAGAVAPTPGRRKLVYVGLAIALVVLSALVLTIFRGASSNDPYDVATREMGQKLLDMPEFKARYGDVTTDERAYQIGQEIALKGVPRLGDADLLRYWQLTNKMIASADPAICGRIFKQTASPDDARRTARTLDLESFRQLLEVTMRAFQADLRGDPVRPAPSNEALTTAFLALQVSMGAGITDAATKLTDKSASDADVCTAGRSFLGAVLQLGEPDRTVITRYMTAAGAGT